MCRFLVLTRVDGLRLRDEARLAFQLRRRLGRAAPGRPIMIIINIISSISSNINLFVY